MKQVSVVMATFNGARFLGGQLQTLADQTLTPAEVIVADDGSTDSTVEIVRRFAKEAPFPVRIIQNKKRLGYGENFLSATRCAEGDYVAFCDQDDLWRKDKLMLASDALTQTDCDLYVHGAELIDEHANHVSLFSQGIRAKRVIEPLHSAPWGVFYGFSMVFSRSLLDCLDSSLRGAHTFEHNTLLSHDLWVYFVGTSLYRTAVDPAPLVQYRQHSTNVTPHLRGDRFRRLTSSLGKAVDPALPRDTIAYQRSSLLHELGTCTADRHLSMKAFSAAEYWTRVGDVESRRRHIYNGSIMSRTKNYLGVAASSGYARPQFAGLGWQLALKDALAGVGGIRR